jgi:mannosyltransferase OCH1-like enzyme
LIILILSVIAAGIWYNQTACHRPQIANDIRLNKFGQVDKFAGSFSWEKNISEQELLEMVQDNQFSKIIHQSWKTTQLSGNFLKWTAKWKSIHPDYQYILWTDEDNRLLVQKYYSWFLPAYDMFPRHIMRVDLARAFYLHRYGGIYADMDVIPIRNHDSLLLEYADFNLIFGTIAEDEDFKDNVPNAWMVSNPQVEFWMMYLNLATQRAFSYCHHAETVSGPVLLRDAIAYWKRIKGPNDIALLKAGLVYGVDWRKWIIADCKHLQSTTEIDGDDERCFSHFPGIYAFTAWTHSWEPYY